MSPKYFLQQEIAFLRIFCASIMSWSVHFIFEINILQYSSGRLWITVSLLWQSLKWKSLIWKHISRLAISGRFLPRVYFLRSLYISILRIHILIYQLCLALPLHFGRHFGNWSLMIDWGFSLENCLEYPPY
jgi:hypothetical protein